MTTIVRSGDTVYTDSCYGSPAGTERTRVYGEPKFFINRNKTYLAAICGSVPSIQICEFFTGSLSEHIERYMGNYLHMSTTTLTSALESLFNGIRKTNPDYDVNFTIVFFTKDVTLQINCKHDKNRTRVTTVVYTTYKDIAFGSGAAWWIAQKDTNLSIEDKFSAIYRLDNNSGGTINVFELNQLKEIKI